MHGDAVFAIDTKNLGSLLKEDRPVAVKHRGVDGALAQDLLELAAHQIFASTPQGQRGSGRNLPPGEVDHFTPIVQHWSERHVAWLGQFRENAETPSRLTQPRHGPVMRCRQNGVWARVRHVHGEWARGGLCVRSGDKCGPDSAACLCASECPRLVLLQNNGHVACLFYIHQRMT
jgi:hypothetical protein